MHVMAYEIIRKLDEERRERSMKRFWWRYAPPATEIATPLLTRDADVIEMVFGTQCEAEEPIGA